MMVRVNLMAEQPTILDDAPLLANVIRIFIATAGFTLAGLLTKIAWWEWRDSRKPDAQPNPALGGKSHGWERVAFILATALLCLTPAVSTLFRIDAPLQGVTTPMYVVGLGLATVVVGYRTTLPLTQGIARRLRRRRRTRGR